MKCTLLNHSFKEGKSQKGNPWKMVRAEILYVDDFGKNRSATISVFESKPGQFDFKDGAKYQLVFSLRRNRDTNFTEAYVSGIVAA